MYAGEDGIFWMDITDFQAKFSEIMYVYMMRSMYTQTVRGEKKILFLVL